MAVNIADKYLATLSRISKPAPHIITLGVVSLLMAVKINEPVVPNMRNMVILINEKNRCQLALQDLLQLEKQILIALNFDI